MKRLVVIVVGVTLAISLLAANVVYADPPGMGDNDPAGQVIRGNAVFTKLENKNPGAGWQAVIGDGTWGWIVTKQSAGAFSASLSVRGLTPSSWYIVTLQDANGDGINAFTGSDGLFGVKGPGFGLDGFIDVALFMTDAAGNADEVTIPTTSGLVAADCNVVYLGSGNLLPGNYTGVTIAVKEVGIGTWGGVPGRPNWWDPVPPNDGIPPNLLWPSSGLNALYESASINFIVK